MSQTLDRNIRARDLAQRETFFHWWTSFPTVFGAGAAQGFDAVIGNPPWPLARLLVSGVGLPSLLIYICEL